MSRSSPKYRLVERFRNVFEGNQYKHRDSSIGDSIAIELYEDLHNLQKSAKLISRIENHERVINVQNVRQGVKARKSVAFYQLRDSVVIGRIKDDHLR